MCFEQVSDKGAVPIYQSFYLGPFWKEEQSAIDTEDVSFTLVASPDSAVTVDDTRTQEGQFR
jgi:hypothetical protein